MAKGNQILFEDISKFPDHIKEQIYKQFPDLRPAPPFTGVEWIDFELVRIVVDGEDFGEEYIPDLIEQSYIFRKHWQAWVKAIYMFNANAVPCKLPVDLQELIFYVIDLHEIWKKFRQERSLEFI